MLQRLVPCNVYMMRQVVGGQSLEVVHYGKISLFSHCVGVVLGSVHTHAFSFDYVTILLRIGLLSTRKR